ncbi:hypothetical protein L218DRAFT_431461 [Marasmius fiardii PR-910]|nr:hypothetical protein L218DRAFT_431461 [Marasmius fiardii PR-910]
MAQSNGTRELGKKWEMKNASTAWALVPIESLYAQSLVRRTRVTKMQKPLQIPQHRMAHPLFLLIHLDLLRPRPFCPPTQPPQLLPLHPVIIGDQKQSTRYLLFLRYHNQQGYQSLIVQQVTPQTPTAHLRRAFTSPKLNSPLPGHTRFSLTDGDSARLSPSIIIRQPVWPILHLPASGPTPSEQPAPSPVGSGLPSRRPSTSSTIGVRLRHMPALTMDGNGEHEEVNEEDLIDESESSEEEDEDAANSGDDGDEDGYESARSSTSANVASGPRTAPPVPPKDRETTTPKPSSLRTPRFGQFSGATHDYFSGVFSPSPSTPSRTAKEKPPFYVTPASTPFDQPPSTSTTPSNPPMLPPVLTTAPLSFPPFSLSPSTPTGRTGSNVHKRASKSMFDLSFSLPESGQDGVLDNVGGIGRKPSTKKLDEPPGDHNKKLDATTPIAPTSTTPIPIQTPTPGLPPSSSEDRQNPTPTSSSLKRRRSMPLFTPNSPPPPYPAFHHHHPQSLHAALSPPPHPSSSSAQSHPTDPPPPLHHDEGREELPAYSNSIYIRSVMPRKMEFIKPQVPAKDRKWRRVVCELEGTAFRVYEFRQKGAGNAGRCQYWGREY